jgi:hypothetical protein
MNIFRNNRIYTLDDSALDAGKDMNGIYNGEYFEYTPHNIKGTLKELFIYLVQVKDVPWEKAYDMLERAYANKYINSILTNNYKTYTLTLLDNLLEVN